MTDRISLVSSGAGDSLEDIEREKLLLEKDKEQQDRESKMARGAETILQDEWSEEFAAGYGLMRLSIRAPAMIITDMRDSVLC